MKRSILSFCILLLSLLSYTQADHLEPAKDISKYDGILRSYYDKVFPLLYNGFSQTPSARYTSMPSFQIEHAFSIEYKNGRYIIISNWFTDNYWYANYTNTGDNVKVKSSSAEIGEDLYQAIVDLFQILADQIQVPKDKFLGNDGTTYYFATTDSLNKIQIGETWSPRKGSKLKRLVSICDKLFSAGQGDYISEEDVLNQINDLISDLKE